MTDEEMIRWLRKCAADGRSSGGLPDEKESYCEAIADRLEALAYPELPAEGPVSRKREAIIRERFAARLYVESGCVGDLLALLDHERERADEAEAWCARLANDRGGECDHAQQQIGVAKALAVLQEAHGYCAEVSHHAGANTLESVMDRIRDRCGPSALPPHERTLTQLERLEQGLLELRQHLGRIPGLNHGALRMIRQLID